MGRCKNCLLPGEVPEARLDACGVCEPCRIQPTIDRKLEERRRQRWEDDLERSLRECRGRGQYDCMVTLSGGKDSCYLLYRIKEEYKLNVLAFTVNVNIPDVAWRNIRRTVERLDVPHLVYTPPQQVYRKMFRYLLQHQEARGAVRTVCYVCAPLTEGYALQVAVEKRIPLILAGYSPGQPEPERMLYEFNPRLINSTDWTPPELRTSGQFSDEELSLFWNPYRYPAGTEFPRFLAPFHAWPYRQDETIRRVVELGLAVNKRHASPVFSNCEVNWLLMYSDLKHLGYNPYAPEFSALIRQHKASRWYWRLMGPLVNFMIRRQILLGRNVRRSFKLLGLQPDDLRITRQVPADREPQTGNGAADGAAAEHELCGVER